MAPARFYFLVPCILGSRGRSLAGIGRIAPNKLSFSFLKFIILLNRFGCFLKMKTTPFAGGNEIEVLCHLCRILGQRNASSGQGRLHCSLSTIPLGLKLTLPVMLTKQFFCHSLTWWRDPWLLPSRHFVCMPGGLAWQCLPAHKGRKDRRGP